MSLTLFPITLREANAFVREHHRHSKPVRGQKWSVAVKKADGICGVAIAGRPVARVAQRFGRRWSGIELNPEYGELAAERSVVTIGFPLEIAGAAP